MSNGWVKYFKDGTQEDGWDQLVNLRKASWSNGRLDGMTGAFIEQNGSAICIFGEGEYWQTDTFEARFLVSEGVRVERTLYRKLTDDDYWLCFDDGGGNETIFVESIKSNIPATRRMAIRNEWRNKWITLTIKENNQIIWDVRDLG